MKVNKILNDLINAWYKDKVKVNADYHYGLDDDNVYIIYKAIVAYRIPKDEFILDIDKVLDSSRRFNNVVRFFDNERKAKTLTYAYDKELEPKKYVTVLKLGDEEIILDKKLLKTFEGDKYTIVTYKGTGHKQPVFIYHDGDLVGLLLPINVK